MEEHLGYQNYLNKSLELMDLAGYRGTGGAVTSRLGTNRVRQISPRSEDTQSILRYSLLLSLHSKYSLC